MPTQKELMIRIGKKLQGIETRLKALEEKHEAHDKKLTKHTNILKALGGSNQIGGKGNVGGSFSSVSEKILNGVIELAPLILLAAGAHKDPSEEEDNFSDDEEDEIDIDADGSAELQGSGKKTNIDEEQAEHEFVF